MKSFPAISICLLAIALASCERREADTTALRDLERDVAALRTKLRRVGPSPQMPHDYNEPPAGVQEITYPSGDLKLKAWIARPPSADPNAKLPAVVYCHTGFAFGLSDWTGDAQPFLDAGFVVMQPMSRGENENPGAFELFLSEVDDVNAAGRYVASLPNVDPARVFVAGHTNGATLATLAVMKTTPFTACASISAVLDVREVQSRWEQSGLVLFDIDDEAERTVRSPMLYASSIRVPLRMYVGNGDTQYETTQRFGESAEFFHKPCEVVPLVGDHKSVKPEALRLAIEWFQTLK